MTFKFAGRFAGIAAGLLFAAGAAQAAPDLAHMPSAELAAFTEAMPKGGELHNHLAGAIFAEDLLAWAAEDGLCVDMTTLSIVTSCQGGGSLKSTASVIADDTERSAMIDSLSVRHPGFRDRSGHDQFFSAFSRMATTPKRNGDQLAVVLEGLARQNTFYAELMVSPHIYAARVLGAKVGWQGDAARTRDALSAAGLEAMVLAAQAETDAMEARAREVMACGTPKADPGCQVTTRYLMQAIRLGPPAATMAQLQLGVALVAVDKRWVGLQLVAPEDAPDALTYYDQHMQMIDVLTDHGRKVPVTLHAGELTADVATPKELSFHIAEAIHVAGARRIGHGVDLPLETNAEALAAEMAAKGILVEVNLSSNAAILGVAPKDHPYAWLRARGVPVSLSTDDAGLLRIDLSHEYATAVKTGATYEDLKRSARNALAYSFLTGEGLWQDPNIYARPATACAEQIGMAEPKGACAALVARSDKAREQWRYERRSKLFEDGFRP